jgi:hypothetical protein
MAGNHYSQTQLHKASHLRGTETTKKAQRSGSKSGSHGGARGTAVKLYFNAFVSSASKQGNERHQRLGSDAVPREDSMSRKNRIPPHIWSLGLKHSNASLMPTS